MEQLTSLAKLAEKAHRDYPGVSLASLYCDDPHEWNMTVEKLLSLVDDGHPLGFLARLYWQDWPDAVCSWSSLTNQEQTSCTRETMFIVEHVLRHRHLQAVGVQDLRQTLLAPRS